MTVAPPRASVVRRALAGPGTRALLAVALIAATVRIALVVRSPGGLGGDLGYDPSVYYAAGDALVHGRMPYSDFTLLHPPGLMLLLAPFAALGAVTTDHAGFVVANVSFELLGAVNAALVVAVGRRYGVARGPAIAAGLVYATWYAAAHRTRERIRPLVTGVVAAAVVIDGPFFLSAPSAMWRMVVSDQVGRPSGVSTGYRIGSLSALSNLAHGSTPDAFVLGLTVVVAAVVVTLAWQVRAARPVVTVAVLQLAVLIEAPSFFAYYAGYVTAPLAVVIGAALTTLRGRVRIAVAVPLTGLAALTTAIVLVTGSPSASARFPAGAVSEAAEHARCVMSDTPEALINADVLSRDLANGCPNWVDVTGRTYDVDASTGPHYVIRAERPVWQRDLRRYLAAGQVIVLERPTTGIGAGIHAWLARSASASLSRDGVQLYQFGRHDDHDGDGPGIDAGRRPDRHPTP